MANKKWKLHKKDFEAMCKLRAKINKSDIRDIDLSDWFDEISEETYKRFEFTGLNNCDFITCDYPNNPL